MDETLKNAFREVLCTLSDRERQVQDYRFGLTDGFSRTLEETGRMFNLTRERIRQIEKKALDKLQHKTRRGMFDRLVEEAGDEPIVTHGDEAMVRRAGEASEAFGKVLEQFGKFPFFAKMVARLLDAVREGRAAAGRIALAGEGFDEELWYGEIAAMRKAVVEAGERLVAEMENPEEARQEFLRALGEVRPSPDAVLACVADADETLYQPYKRVLGRYASLLVRKRSQAMEAELANTRERKESFEAELGMTPGTFLNEFAVLRENVKNFVAIRDGEASESRMDASGLFGD